MIRKSLCIAVAVAALCPAVTLAAPKTVAVYDSTQIALGNYTVVKRMNVADWKSAFWIGGYSDEESARNALLAQAAEVGADGVINLHCMGQTDRIFNSAGYSCYGNAIRLKSGKTSVAGEQQ